MEEKLFPSIPSALELAILSYVNYCQVCKIHGDKEHDIKLCFNCDRKICYNFDDNIWVYKNNNKEICEKCRMVFLKKYITVTFTRALKYSNLKTNTVK